MLLGIEWDTSSPLSLAISILPILLRGMIITLEATFLGFFVAMDLGLILAALKSASTRLISWSAAVITEFIRDTPLLIQLLFLFYVLPEYSIVLPAFLTGALALGLQYSANLSEVYRVEIEAVPDG